MTPAFKDYILVILHPGRMTENAYSEMNNQIKNHPIVSSYAGPIVLEEGMQFGSMEELPGHILMHPGKLSSSRREQIMAHWKQASDDPILILEEGMQAFRIRRESK